MERRLASTLLSTIMLSLTLTGCLSGESSGGSQSEVGSADEFAGLDYIDCMMHEDMERCWNVFVPKTVNLTEAAPMIIDLHGNTVTMENQRKLSEFDDIAEENGVCLLYTSPSPRDLSTSRMPSSA